MPLQREGPIEVNLLKIVSKRLFRHFKDHIDVRRYQEVVTKFISMEVEPMKQMFFTLLDTNHDGKVCETDMFSIMA